MATTENHVSYKVMVNFNQDLIKDTETFKKLTQSPVIEVENDLYKIDLSSYPDTLINVNCTNIQTNVYSSSKADYYEYGEGHSIPNGKEITAKCHSIAKKIQDDISEKQRRFIIINHIMNKIRNSYLLFSFFYIKNQIGLYS